MSTNVEGQSVSPNDAKPMLAAAFFSELSKLLKKYDANIIIERVWENEYDSHAELDFQIGEQFILGNWNAAPLKKIDADEIMKLSQSCG